MPDPQGWEDWQAPATPLPGSRSRPRPIRKELAANGHDPNPLVVWDAGLDTEPVPPRGWLLGSQFCRGFVSSLVGPGAVGKSAVRLTQYLSLATGRELSGEHVFRRSRVLLISLEDGRDELRRRLLAARIHHRIDLADLAGWLYLATPETLRIAGSNGDTPEEMDGLKAVEGVIQQFDIDLAALDPFKKAHACEENDNNAIDFVATLLTRVAIRRNIAVDLAHHARKGAAVSGDADIGRGAGALKDAIRLGYTLTAMTPEDALSLGIEEAQRRSLVRLDSAKVNIAPPVTQAIWFQLCGVALGNETDDYPKGDHVQAAEPWKPTGIFDAIAIADINGALDVIAGGLPRGEKYSRRPQDKERWAGTVLVQGMKIEAARAKAIIATWLNSGLLFEDEYESPSQRKMRKCVMVNPEKRPGLKIDA